MLCPVESCLQHTRCSVVVTQPDLIAWTSRDTVFFSDLDGKNERLWSGTFLIGICSTSDVNHSIQGCKVQNYKQKNEYNLYLSTDRVVVVAGIRNLLRIDAFDQLNVSLTDNNILPGLCVLNCAPKVRIFHAFQKIV